MIVDPGLDLRKRAWWAIAALIVLLMLPNVIWACVGQSIERWMNGLLIPALLLLIFLAVLGDRLWLACVLLSPFAALAPVEACYIATYHNPSGALILATIIATNQREAHEYLGHALVPILLCTVAGFALALLAMRWSWQSGINWRHRSRSWVLLSVITLPLTILAISIVNAPGNAVARMNSALTSLSFLYAGIESGYPFGFLPRVAQYRHEWREMREASARLDAFRFQAHRVIQTQKRQVYVLVIGESSRRSNWQLFGYERATNPELTKTANLVPIPDLVSSWPVSLLSIPMILTRKPISDHGLTWSEASILRAMAESDFDTYWISNQLAIGGSDSPVSTYAYEAQHIAFLNHASWADPGSYDEVLLQPLQDALQDTDRDLFVILHMMGSHMYYDLRYPDSFKRFRPAQSDSDSGGNRFESARNSYDNTILYTDHVLARVIEMLRTTNAISSLFYESDHGEDLPTPQCALTEHGNGTRYDYEIPGLFWYSDAYAAAFPERLAALRENASQRVLSHNTFESLIDMAGIDFPGHDHSFSLFSTQWRYRPRTVNGFWQVDIDNAVLGKQCELVMPRKE